MNTQVSTHKTQQLEDFAALFNQFFFDLQAIFPAWRQAFPTTEHLTTAKRNWYAALRENKITSADQINTGLRRARAEGSDFFPSPAKFVAWCKPQPEDFGLPSLEAAYSEAIAQAGRVGRRHWTHAAIHEAACRVGMYELSRMPEADARKAFASVYRQTFDDVVAGKLQLALPAPDDGRPVDKSKRDMPKAIIEKKSPEAHLADIRRLLGTSKTTQTPHQVDRDDPMLKNEADAA